MKSKLEMSLITKLILVLCVAVIFVFDCCSASITHKSNSNVEEIPDFEFDDNFPIDKQHHHPLNLNYNDFDDFFIDDGESDDDHTLDIGSKEKMLKDAILRALSTKELKYKFSEVLPLLRHLSKAQRMVFSSIISAQINGGRSFTFDEVSCTYMHLCSSSEGIKLFTNVIIGEIL